ncbi:hypothetical protein M0R72_13830 [Candidatus Pacearchaeota archaeon]|jgi:hypothetical protein|nr:hypothetical protein [Candidatus Pacearchaeota archaeon]
MYFARIYKDYRYHYLSFDCGMSVYVADAEIFGDSLEAVEAVQTCFKDGLLPLNIDHAVIYHGAPGDRLARQVARLNMVKTGGVNES